MIFQSLLRQPGIGANCYSIDFEGGERLVIDCGIDPKEEGIETLPQIAGLAFDSVDTVLISHAHLDHLGGFPVLARQQPSAELYMTDPTFHIARAMMHNSVNVMTFRREETGDTDYPFYTHREVDRVLRRVGRLPLERTIEIAGGAATMELYEAGHVLGAAAALITAGGRRVLYTGDIHFEDQTLVRAARLPEENIDTLIVETTHGLTERDPAYTRERECERLAAVIRETCARGGSVLIPVFALGKTQEFLVMLDLLRKSGQIPNMPIHIGGLSTKVTTIFDKMADRAPRHHQGLRILDEIDISVVSKKTGKEISYNPGCIYALSSGMMSENTVSNNFAPSILGNPANTLAFVGYTAPTTPGGRLREAGQGGWVTLDERRPPVEIKCGVESFDFSGHAPRDQVLDYICRVAPKQVLLVHGDPGAMEWFRAQVSERLPDSEVVGPEPGVPLTIGE